MSIKSKIVQTLTPLGVEVYFLEKVDNNTFPFIVFNVNEIPAHFSDDEEDGTMYLVAVNIFSKPDYNFESLKLDIIDAMKTAGFKKQKVPQTEYMEQQDVYNQPIGFSYYESK